MTLTACLSWSFLPCRMNNSLHCSCACVWSLNTMMSHEKNFTFDPFLPVRHVHSHDGRAPPHPSGCALWHLPLHGGHLTDGHPAVRTHHAHGHARQASPRPHLRHQGNTHTITMFTCPSPSVISGETGKPNPAEWSLQPRPGSSFCFLFFSGVSGFSFDRVTRLFGPMFA